MNNVQLMCHSRNNIIRYKDVEAELQIRNKSQSTNSQEQDVHTQYYRFLLLSDSNHVMMHCKEGVTLY